MTLLIAQIPDASYIVIGCVVIATLCLVGLGVILKSAQTLRTSIASELKRELQSVREVYPVAVQQPLIVKPEAQIVTREELEKVDLQLHGRHKRERTEIDAQIKRVEDAAERRAEKLDVKLDQNTRLTSEMSGEVKQINQNVNQLTVALTSYLRDQATK